MGWRPNEVRATSLSDFASAIEAFNELHGGKGEMTEAEALALREELWGEDG